MKVLCIKSCFFYVDGVTRKNIYKGDVLDIPENLVGSLLKQGVICRVETDKHSDILEISEKLKHIRVGRLKGIGKVTVSHLGSIGIVSCEELLQAIQKGIKLDIHKDVLQDIESQLVSLNDRYLIKE